jgi:hypothetical protein
MLDMIFWYERIIEANLKLKQSVKLKKRVVRFPPPHKL